MAPVANSNPAIAVVAGTVRVKFLLPNWKFAASANSECESLSRKRQKLIIICKRTKMHRWCRRLACRKPRPRRLLPSAPGGDAVNGICRATPRRSPRDCWLVRRSAPPGWPRPPPQRRAGPGRSLAGPNRADPTGRHVMMTTFSRNVQKATELRATARIDQKPLRDMLKRNGPAAEWDECGASARLPLGCGMGMAGKGCPRLRPTVERGRVIEA